MVMTTLGILGGMGPVSTAYTYQRLVDLTDGQSDQEHLNTLIYSKCDTPNRIEAILAGDDEDVGRHIRHGVRVLEDGGATVIIVACNTAHHWIDDARNAVSTPVLDLIEETAKHIASAHPMARDVGLMASLGTIHSGLYQDRFGRHGLSVRTPDEMVQRQVSALIDDVKAGLLRGVGQSEIAARVNPIITGFRHQGIYTIVAGCSEISMVTSDGFDDLIDPIDLVLKKIIAEAGFPLRPVSGREPSTHIVQEAVA